MAKEESVTVNLCKLSQADQEAIQLDKMLWYTAYLKITTCQRNDVLNWLDTLPKDQQKDMRDRLNTIHTRLKKQYSASTQRMQKGLRTA